MDLLYTDLLHAEILVKFMQIDLLHAYGLVAVYTHRLVTCRDTCYIPADRLVTCTDLPHMDLLYALLIDLLHDRDLLDTFYILLQNCVFQ